MARAVVGKSPALGARSFWKYCIMRNSSHYYTLDGGILIKYIYNKSYISIKILKSIYFYCNVSGKVIPIVNVSGETVL